MTEPLGQYQQYVPALETSDLRIGLGARRVSNVRPAALLLRNAGRGVCASAGLVGAGWIQRRRESHRGALQEYGALLNTGTTGRRVAVVTGSSRGIGSATAHALARDGIGVVVHGTDAACADSAALALESDAVPVVGDLTSRDLPERLVRTAIDSFGRLDIVVNNAGFNWDAPFADMSNAQLLAMLEVHVVAPLRLLKTAEPHLLDAGHESAPRTQRKVVNVSSICGTMGSAGQVAYSAAKAGIIGVTKALAKEWGPHGVSVNAVAPGFVDTRLTSTESSEITYAGDRIKLGISPERRKQMADHVPLGRPGTPAEVANVIAFLCSPASDYVNGQVLTVSGGITLGMES